MPKLSDDFKNEVLSHAEELVSRHKEILTKIEIDRKEGRTIRPTDSHITKFWPLKMLLVKYGAFVLRVDLRADITPLLGIGRRQRLQVRKHALKYLKDISIRQRKEKMQQEWQRQLEPLPC